MQMNATVKQMNNLPKVRVEELEKRSKAEDKYFVFVQSSGVWDTDYQEGRISGSHAWKSVRGELGDNNSKKVSDGDNDKGEKSEEASLVVESFYPAPHHRSELLICVQHLSSFSIESITVNGVPCAATLSNNGTSVVIIDEKSGCILQSRAFSSWMSVGAFVDTVPDGRIVALISNVSSTAIDDATTKHLQRVGGLINDKSLPEHLMFVGQVGCNPKWTSWTNLNDASKSVNVSIQIDIPSSLQPKLRSEVNTIPTTVSTRLPEAIMPLKTQIAATAYQKRVAFEAFMNQQSESSYGTVGYVSFLWNCECKCVLLLY